MKTPHPEDVEGTLALARAEAAAHLFDTRMFYELCQQYRWAKEMPQTEVIAAFEALKDFGRAAIAKATGIEA
jgi:hypothetical protein